MSLNILFIILVTSIYKVTSECNGSPLLCNRSYSDITHLVTHDSYAIMPNIAATQDMTIIQQLDDGVRGIKLSAVSESELRLCHSYCHVLDAGTVIDTLNSIAEWLESNPKEVVTIMWNNLYQYNVNSIADAYLDSNIMPYVFTHKLLDSWPTLQQMIDSGHRLVNFVDMQSNETSHPWLMDQFTRIFETPYEITDIDDFNCNIDRRSPDISPSDMMYVMNHFLYSVFEIGALKIEIPAKNKAAVTNSQSLIDHTINCTMVFERKPNFVEVDFYNIGDVLDLIEELNGIAASNNNSMNSNVQELVKNIAATSHNPNRKKQNIQYQYNASSTLTISVCFPFCLLTLAFFLPFVLY